MLHYVFLCLILCCGVRADEKEERDSSDRSPLVRVGAWLYPGAKNVDCLEPVEPNDFRKSLLERLGDFARCSCFGGLYARNFVSIDNLYRIFVQNPYFNMTYLPDDLCCEESDTQMRFSTEKIPFPGLPISLPSFFVLFYQSVQKEACKNGRLWQEALLDKDPCKIQNLQLPDIKELDWLLYREFGNLWVDCFKEMYEDLTKVIGDAGYVYLPKNYPNPTGAKDSLEGYHPYDSRTLWGDTVLPCICVGSDHDQNIHIGLLRLRDLLCLLNYEMSEAEECFPNNFDSNGSTRLLFNKLVIRSVYLIQRRIEKIAP